MRVILDTNVVVSALLWGGTPERLIEAAGDGRIELVAIVDAPPVAAAELRDPDDVAVLACALAARVDAIVSGDADLLVLGNFRGIPILSPTACVARMAA